MKLSRDDLSKVNRFVSIPKRVSEALKLEFVNLFLYYQNVSIPKRVSEALKRYMRLSTSHQRFVSIPKRVSEALKLSLLMAMQGELVFQSLKGFQRL